MIADPKNQSMSPTDYLEWEAQQPIKYEYLSGIAYAMTGGTIPHNDIALNLYRALYPHLRSKGCRVNVADVNVQVSNNGPYFYPDVIVSCHEQDQRAHKLIQFPCLIVEILSPGTAGFDRGEKFRAYRRLHTLQEYVLIDAETRNVECYCRNRQGKWELTAYPPDEDTDNGSDPDVHFTSIDFRCSLSLLYENIDFPEPFPENTPIAE